MRYFKYKPQRNMGKIWELFYGLSDVQLLEAKEKNASRRSDYKPFEYVYEAISSAMRMSLSELQEFNVESYQYKTHQYVKMNKSNQAKKVMSFVEDREEVQLYGVILSSQIADDRYSADEDVIIQDWFDSSIARLRKIRKFVILDKGIDLVVVLEKALNNVQDFVLRLKNLTDSDDEIKDIVEGLLSGGDPGMLQEKLSLMLLEEAFR